VGLTYYLRDCEEQDAFCDALIRALRDGVVAARQHALPGHNAACLHVEGAGDLYHAVTDALRESVPPELWTAVSTLGIGRSTAEAIEWRPLLASR